MRISNLSLIASLFVGIHAAAASEITNYRITDLGVNVQPESINNGGSIAGVTGDVKAFIWQDGIRTSLGILPDGTGFSRSISINDHDQITGWSSTNAQFFRGFIWNNGVMSALPFESSATSPVINNKGQIAGNTADGRASILEQGVSKDIGQFRVNAINNKGQVIGANNSTIVIWDSERTIELEKPFGLTSLPEVSAINDFGQLVGYVHPSYSTPYNLIGFLWDDGHYINLGDLPGMYTHSLASDVNNLGQVVGYSSTSSASFLADYSHAFIWQKGEMTDLNSLIAPDDPLKGLELKVASAINDNGQIIGMAWDGHNYRGYLLTPMSQVPEPAGYALLLAGLATLICQNRRRCLNVMA